MADGITKIAVEGFKSIATRQEIEIRPLTILAGANSSGKSSIMQPLLMLKQTLDATYDPGPLKLDGENVFFTSSDQFLCRSLAARTDMRVTIATAPTVFEFVFRPGAQGLLELSEESVLIGPKWVQLRPGMSSVEIAKAIGHPPPSGFDFTLVRNRFLLHVRADTVTHLFIEDVVEPIRRVIHVPSLRSNRSRTYSVAGAGPDFQGTFDHYVASVLAHWHSTGDSAAEDR
jgi:AAA ATPase domain